MDVRNNILLSRDSRSRSHHRKAGSPIDHRSIPQTYACNINIPLFPTVTDRRDPLSGDPLRTVSDSV